MVFAALKISNFRGFINSGGVSGLVSSASRIPYTVEILIFIPRKSYRILGVVHSILSHYVNVGFVFQISDKLEQMHKEGFYVFHEEILEMAHEKNPQKP